MALTLPNSLYLSPVDKTGERPLWDSHLVLQQLQTQQPNISLRTAERAIIEAKLVPTSLKLVEIRDEHGSASQSPGTRQPGVAGQTTTPTLAGHSAVQERAQPRTHGKRWPVGSQVDVY